MTSRLNQQIFDEATSHIMQQPQGRSFMWNVLCDFGFWTVASEEDRMRAVDLWEHLGACCPAERKKMVMDYMDDDLRSKA